LSTYDEEVREALASKFRLGELRDIGGSELVLTPLSDGFPVRGSKIDWDQVAGAVGRATDGTDEVADFIAFFDEVRQRFGLEGNLRYAGDSGTDFALEGTVDAIRGALPVLFKVPQHHYFTPPDHAWVLCLTMEGDMDFGYRPSASG